MGSTKAETVMEPSRRRATGWVFLALFAPIGGWLLWEIGRREGLGSGHLWELLRTDRTFGFAMLDFLFTAGFAAIVLVERSNLKAWRNWVALVVFFAIPTLGIILFLLIGETRRGEGRAVGSKSDLT